MALTYILELSNFRVATASFCLTWYGGILAVAYYGFFEILRNLKSRPRLSYNNSNTYAYLEDDPKFEGVLIVRPIKGIDPGLWECLELSFTQNFPVELIQILFCVDDPNDEAIPLIRRLISQYPTVDAEILLSDGYDPTTGVSSQHFGPNPKVNNLAKGFAHAKYDILWVMDSNVYAGPGVLRNSIQTLNHNLNNGHKLNDDLARTVKLVHHVPLAINGCARAAAAVGTLGALLDEMFLFTLHAKFYVLLNNISVAPCVNGKSNLYRKSDLDLAVAKIASNPASNFFGDARVRHDALEISRCGPGSAIRFFARYIGEDNMIAIALWENVQGRTGLTGDVVVQPLCIEGGSVHRNSVKDYIQRRARWLRARKYMVFAATLVEPTTELIICGIIGTYAISTLFMNRWFLWGYFFFHASVWCLTDYVQFKRLADRCTGTAETGRNSIPRPEWLSAASEHSRKLNICQWLGTWFLREMLALPIWAFAMAGHEIDWRGKPFRILKDLSAEEL